jgi:hypothetical protein
VEPICLQGRTLTGDHLRALRACIAQHPDWRRVSISFRASGSGTVGLQKAARWLSPMNAYG